MQFEDTASGAVTLVPAAAAARPLRIIVHDVAVDMTAVAAQQQGPPRANSAAAHQMLYVDLSWRNKKFRTTASARAVTSTNASASFGDASATGDKNTAASTLTNPGPALVESEQDVMVVSLRRAELFGDQDAATVAFRLADVPWVAHCPIVVRAGPFLLSLQPGEGLGAQLPPELTLAERIDFVGGTVDVAFATGEAARRKQVPPALESSRRVRDKIARGSSAGARSAAGDVQQALADGTASQAAALKRKLDGADPEPVDTKKQNADTATAAAAAAASASAVHPVDAEYDSIPAEVREIIEAQVPPDLPLVASIGVECEIPSGAAVSNATFGGAVNACSAALSEAACQDVARKLQHALTQSTSALDAALVPFAGGASLAERVAFASASPGSQHQLQPLPLCVEVQNVQLLLPGSSSSSSSPSATPIIIGIELTVRCARDAPPALAAFILRALPNMCWVPDDLSTCAFLLTDAVQRQMIEDKTAASSGAAAAPAAAPSDSVAPANAISINIASVSLVKFESNPKMGADPANPKLPSVEQQELWAEQKRVLAALRRLPLEILLNESGPLLRWRGCVPDERAPRPSLLYRRTRSVRDSLVAACLLPVPAAPAQQGGVSGFFKGIASKAANAAAAVGQAIDTSLLLHRDFPELKGGERDAAVVAETFECECLNGRGVPVKGRVYILGAGRILFHGKGSNSADAGLHVNWSLVTDVICIRRVSSMGTEAVQVLARGGAALQFSAFDGFFARLSFSLGIRSFTKFFDFVGALVDVHGAQRCPVAAGRLTDE